jgi:hypothetical protein
VTGRANGSTSLAGDARRSLASTCAFGVGLGGGAFALFLGLACAFGAFDGYAGLLLGPALMYGLPLAAIVGTVCAFFLLRRRNRALRRAVWMIPLITVPVTLALGIATAYAGKALQEKLESAQMLRTVTANYSGHWIRNVSLLGSDCPWDHPEYGGVAPETAPVPLKVEREGRSTPAWDAHRTLALSWFRPLHGARFDEADFDAPTALVHAEVSLPPYRGTIGKVFTIAFLPDDQVRVEAVSASSFDGEVRKPVHDPYVAQGVVQACAGQCCPP